MTPERVRLLFEEALDLALRHGPVPCPDCPAHPGQHAGELTTR
jgi:hypothetical protein